eukprot:s941_g1.t1
MRGRLRTSRVHVEMNGEKEPLGMSELGCADGCGRRVCKGMGGNEWGEGAAGDERAWMRGPLRTAWVQAVVERAWMRGRPRTAWLRTAWAQGRWWKEDGVGAREWVEMGREKESLGLSELGCADGCGRRGFDARTGGRRAADGVGASDAVKKVGGEKEPRARMRTGADSVGAKVRVNGWGEGAAGDERAWMRELGCADGCGRRGCKRAAGKLEMSNFDWRTGADGVGAREWVEMCGEKEPAVEMSELGCVRVEKGGEKGHARAWMHGRLRGAREWVGAWGEGAAGDERARMRGRLRKHGCKEVGGNGWGKGVAGDERAWMCGRLRTSELGCVDGCRRLGCKGMGGNGRGEGAVALTAADGVGAREWVEITDGKKELLGMSVLGCADGCGRRGRRESVEMGGEKEPLGMSELGCADGCGHVHAREWVKTGGENEALGMGELGCAEGWRGVQGGGLVGMSELGRRRGREWVEMGGEKKLLGMSELGCADLCGGWWQGSGWTWLGTRSRWDEQAWMRGRLQTVWVQGNGWKWDGLKGWGEGAAGDERAWMRGRLRTAWAQGSGWKGAAPNK